jgi:hypothetical protein
MHVLVTLQMNSWYRIDVMWRKFSNKADKVTIIMSIKIKDVPKRGYVRSYHLFLFFYQRIKVTLGITWGKLSSFIPHK